MSQLQRSDPYVDKFRQKKHNRNKYNELLQKHWKGKIDHFSLKNFEEEKEELLKLIIKLTEKEINIVIDAIKVCKEQAENSGFDSSHDVFHHMTVAQNAIKLLPDNFTPKIFWLSYFGAIYHDLFDHKYQDGLKTRSQAVKEFLNKYCGSININPDDVLWIIDHISYSKEIKAGIPKHSDPDVMMARNIVSDADKIESTGEIAIFRCFEYHTKKLKENEDEVALHVYIHCDEKMKIIHTFCRTDKGKSWAERQTKDILNFMDDFEQMFD